MLPATFLLQAGTMSKLPKFEIELPAAPKSTKLSLSERDIAMATMCVSVANPCCDCVVSEYRSALQLQCWPSGRALNTLREDAAHRFVTRLCGYSQSEVFVNFFIYLNRDWDVNPEH